MQKRYREPFPKKSQSVGDRKKNPDIPGISGSEDEDRGKDHGIAQ
jgi:hypothetical protein